MSGPGLFDDLPAEGDSAPRGKAGRSASPRTPAQKPKGTPDRTPNRGGEREAGQRRAPPRPAVLSVGQLTGQLRGLLEGFGRVSVEGEVSRVTRAASGHVYFDLKDEQAKLACVIWRSNKAAAQVRLEEGMQVVVHGKLDVYAPRGTYSLTVQRIEQSGIGLLLAQFEELKRDLASRGWFERKRPLPSLPETIGVVTSRDGAALRDFLRTRSLRWPLYPVRLVHAPVQGPGASVEIARAIERIDASGVDLIVVTRGGGSLEDLWAFNELPVAAAIRAASVPVVSGVGHEVDTTLADLVADARAHTPTDAAQLVIPDRAALTGELERLSNWLLEAMDGLIEARAERIERAARSRFLRDPGWILADRDRRLAELGRRMDAGVERRLAGLGARMGELHRRLSRQSPRAQLEQRAGRLQRAGLTLDRVMSQRLETASRRLELGAARLEAYSPVKILGRGFSITTAEGDPTPLKRAGDLAPGSRIRTRLHDGSVVSEVVELEPGAAEPPAEPA